MHDRQRREGGPTAHAEFLENVVEMNSHRPFGDIQLAGYLLVRMPLSKREYDFPLAGGQRPQPLLLQLMSHVALDPGFEELGGKPLLPCCHLANAMNQAVSSHIL